MLNTWFIYAIIKIIFILFTPRRPSKDRSPSPSPIRSIGGTEPLQAKSKKRPGKNTHRHRHRQRGEAMATTKMAVVAILAALLLMAAVEPASATPPSMLAARKLQMPRLMDVVLAESKLACLPAGGFCMFRPMDCCGNCGCLYPAGVCYGTRCEEWTARMCPFYY